jgi:hypothetical protein
MTRYGILLPAALLLAALPGCEDDALDPVPESGLEVSFRILNESGVPTSTFRYGEDIVFDYSIRNGTGEDLTWQGYYESFPVGFRCRSGRTELGSNLTGVRPAKTSGVFEDGRTITSRTSWQSNPAMPSLPPGEYEVWGGPSFSIDDYQTTDTYRAATITVLPPLDREYVFSLAKQTWIFGIFGLKTGNLFWADIFRNSSGKYELYASVLVESENPEVVCLPEFGTGECLRQELLPPILLDATEQNTLDELIRDFPTVAPQINGACDPAVTLRYHLGDGIHEVTPCTTGPPEYTEHAWDLAGFVEGVVRGR